MREKLKKILEDYGIGADNLDCFLNAMCSVLICMADEEKASQHDPHTYDGRLVRESIKRLESAAYEILYLKGSLDKK